MNAFRGDDLVGLLSALADLRHKPHAEWMEAFSAAFAVRLASMDPPALSRGMNAFASLRCKPDRALVKAYYLQLYSKLPMFDDFDLATTAQAFQVRCSLPWRHFEASYGFRMCPKGNGG
jgi:hypothetical protein